MELKPVKAELVKSLDSKSAKPGDPVIAKTQEAVKTANGTEFPKGSKLIGTVTLVKPHSKQVQNSELAVKFDRAELKCGQAVPIHSVIRSLSPPADGMAGSSPDMMGAPMGGSPTAAAATAGGAPMGGKPSTGSMPSTAPAEARPKRQPRRAAPAIRDLLAVQCPARSSPVPDPTPSAPRRFPT